MSEKVMQGQVAVVTGAAKRIGRSIALRFAEAGAHVVVNYDSSKAEAEAVVEEIKAKGVNAAALQGNTKRFEVPCCDRPVVRIVVDARRFRGTAFDVERPGVIRAAQGQVRCERSGANTGNGLYALEQFPLKCRYPAMRARAEASGMPHVSWWSSRWEHA